jgi:predicted DNA-binding transcriptional regulator AlpA
MSDLSPDALTLLFANQKDIMMAKELGAVLRMSHKTVYAKANKGEIPYLPVAGKRFLKQEIIEWLRNQNYRPRPRYRNGRELQRTER